MRATHDKTTGRVDQVTRVFQPFFGQHRFDQLFNDGFVERGFHLGGGFRLVGAVLGGQHHGVDAVRLAIHVAHGHLAFRVGTQERQAAIAAQLGLALDQTVRIVNGGRHQLGGLLASVAKHQALVTRTNVQVVVGGVVHALRDVIRLLVIADHDRTTFVVDAVLGVVIADALDGVASDLDVVHMRVGGDFTGQHHQPSVGQGFGSDAAAGVLFEDGIQNCV